MDRIEQETLSEMKQRLIRRLLLAAGLIVVLLGALAIFDHLSKMDQDEEARLASPPVQPTPGPSISSGRKIEPLPIDEPVTPSPSLVPKEAPAEPAAPPKPEVAAQPSLAIPAAVPAASSAESPAGNSPTSVTAVPPTVPMVTAVPEESSGTPMVSAPPEPGKRLPNPAAVASTQAPSGGGSQRSTLSRLASGFVLQAGVFSSPERAEEVKAKLIMAGVPATIESRVQVGPFATQKEADAARKKVRELGIDSIVIPPRGARR